MHNRTSMHLISAATPSDMQENIRVQKVWRLMDFILILFKQQEYNTSGYDAESHSQSFTAGISFVRRMLAAHDHLECFVSSLFSGKRVQRKQKELEFRNFCPPCFYLEKISFQSAFLFYDRLAYWRTDPPLCQIL